MADDEMLNGEEQPVTNGATEAVEEEEEGEGPEKQRIRLLPGSTDTAATFELENEGHTLGNALRYLITKNPAVEICAYLIPHPAEDRMTLRIQTYDNVTAYDVLEKGLDDLSDLCDVVMDKVTAAREEFSANRMTT